MIKRKKLFDILISNAPKNRGADFYHSILNMSWFQVLKYYVLFYIFINLFFASLYFIVPGSLTIPESSFVKCFFFSIQTFSTVGYGAISPHNLYGDIVVSIEIIIGLISVAITTGIVFAKFSKPISKIVFTDKALITKFNDQNVFSFRCANTRNNQIVSAKVELFLLYKELTKEGQTLTRFQSLPLQKDYTPIFALSWTIFHNINESSPLYQLSIDDMKKKGHEFIVLIHGNDDTYNQTIHKTHYYTPDDIVLNHLYEDITKRNPDGTRIIDYQNFNKLREL